MLAQGRNKKHHETIAWILLTCFPSPDSRDAVARLADKQSDEEKRRQYLTILAATPDVPESIKPLFEERAETDEQ
jgi:hypothetical protein